MKETRIRRPTAGVSTRPAVARKLERHSVPSGCLVIFALVWFGLAIAPRHRDAWFLESLLVLSFVPLLILDYRRFRFSDRAYLQITAFLFVHTIGSHYTYSEVPVGDWVRDAFGLARNHYDRFVHLAFGALAFRPVREICFRTGREPGLFATTFLISSAVVALGVAYELIEWLAAVILAPEAGTAFLATQGDEWDAQKDLAMAGLGALAVGIFEIRMPLRPLARVSRLASVSSAGKRRVSRAAAAILLLCAFSTGRDAVAAGSAVLEAEKGRALFLRNCSECHGLDGSGNGPERDYLAKPPADLHDGKIVSRYSDEEIAAFVRDGKRLRLELRPELLKRNAQETEALYRFVRRLPEIDWEKWEAGEEVFLSRCVTCHDYYGGPSPMLPEGVKAPRDLADPKLQASLSDDELKLLVRHGKDGMPALVPRLTEAEANAAVAYVRILSPGYALYDRYCLDCHGMRGEGGTGHLADAVAPEFAFTEEYFESNSADDVRKAIWHMLREKNPSMPHFREALSVTEVKAIIAYLRSLGARSVAPIRHPGR